MPCHKQTTSFPLFLHMLKKIRGPNDQTMLESLVNYVIITVFQVHLAYLIQFVKIPYGSRNTLRLASFLVDTSKNRPRMV